MRKLDKFIIWPAYFDSGKTRKEGRRVTKNLAISSPKINEVEEAANNLDLENEIIPEKGYPKTPWQKTGILLVEKDGSKEEIIERIAKQLLNARIEMQKQREKK